MTATLGQHAGISVLRFVAQEGASANQDLVNRYFEQDFFSQCSDHGDLIIDFTNVKNINSAAMGAIVQVFGRLRNQGHRLVLCHVDSPFLQEVFTLTRLDSLIPTFPTIEDAAEYLQHGVL